MNRVPGYRLHKSSGQALVCLNGRRIYLGVHGSEASKAKYNQLVAEWLAAGAVAPPPSVVRPAGLSVAELALAYVRHARSYYLRSNEAWRVEMAMRRLVDHCGSMDAADLSPVQLDALTGVLAAGGLSRPYANCLLGCIKRGVKWAARKGLIPVATWHQVQLVEGLRKGRTEAREPDAIGPVSEADVEATLGHLPETVADMVRLQRLLGCRPGELVRIRPAEIEMGGEVWYYVPRSHKTAHHDKSRRVAIGPKAQAILRRYLVRAVESPCFSPAEKESKRHEEQRAARKSRVQPSQECRKKPKPRKAPGEQYSVDSYRRAVAVACRRAGVGVWSPNQLRHSAASEVRRAFGLEAAQVLLGHSRADVTQVYAQRNDALAAEIAKRLG